MQFVYHNDGIQTKATSPKISQREKGRLFSIKNDGSDSYPFIVKKSEVLFGSGLTCDIRIYVVGVSKEHCSIEIAANGKAYLKTLADTGVTYLNDLNVGGKVILLHNDIITIGNRRFRFQYPSGSGLTKLVSHRDKVEIDSKKQVSGGQNSLLSKAKRSSLPIQASVNKKSLGFPVKRKSLDSPDFVKRKSLKRRVTFGPHLSPEEFDKRLPPSSPLRRGSLPNLKRSDLHSLTLKEVATSAASEVKTLKLRSSSTHSPDHSEPPVINEKSYAEDSMVKRAAKRLLFSDVVKKPPQLDKFGLKSVPQKKTSPTADKCVKKLETSSNEKNRQYSRDPKKLGISSTGHANSPATIFISKAKNSVARERESIQHGKNTSVIGTENHSCIQNSIGCNLPSETEICVLANSFLHDEQVAGTHRQSKGIKHVSNQSFESSNEEKSKPSQGSSEKQFDSREAIRSLIFNSSLVSELSNNFGETSSLNFMSAIKQIVLALSMANAYHDYKSIIEDIIHSPQKSSLASEVLTKNSSSSNEIIADNEEEMSLKDFLKKNKVFLELINKYQPNLLSKEVQELLKVDKSTVEFSPRPSRKTKETASKNISSQVNLENSESDSTVQKESSLHKSKCSSSAHGEGEHRNTIASKPKLESSPRLNLLRIETAETTNKGVQETEKRSRRMPKKKQKEHSTGIQETVKRCRGRPKKQKEHEPTSEENSLDRRRDSLKRKYSLRAIKLKEKRKSLVAIKKNKVRVKERKELFPNVVVPKSDRTLRDRDISVVLDSTSDNPLINNSKRLKNEAEEEKQESLKTKTVKKKRSDEERKETNRKRRNLRSENSSNTVNSTVKKQKNAIAKKKAEIEKSETVQRLSKRRNYTSEKVSPKEKPLERKITRSMLTRNLRKKTS